MSTSFTKKNIVAFLTDEGATDTLASAVADYITAAVRASAVGAEIKKQSAKADFSSYEAELRAADNTELKVSYTLKKLGSGFYEHGVTVVHDEDTYGMSNLVHIQLDAKAEAKEEAAEAKEEAAEAKAEAKAAKADAAEEAEDAAAKAEADAAAAVEAAARADAEKLAAAEAEEAEEAAAALETAEKELAAEKAHADAAAVEVSLEVVAAEEADEEVQGSNKSKNGNKKSK